VTAGALVLLCAIGVMVFVSSGLAKRVAWERYKPVAWLIRDGRSVDSVTRNSALAELLRRQQAGFLSQQQVDAVVDAALKVQSDRSTTWDYRWGDLVEGARQSGTVSVVQWRTYAEQAVTTNYFWLSVSKRVGTKERPQAMLERYNARVGGARGLYAYSRALGIFVDGREYTGLMDDRDGSDVAEISFGGSSGGGGTRDDLRSAIRGLPPGMHSGYIVYEVRVTPPPPSRGTRGRSSSLDQAARARQYAKQTYAERRAVWSDAGRESAVVVTRLQMPFELEVLEGGSRRPAR
jgi:hypothetical protein